MRSSPRIARSCSAKVCNSQGRVAMPTARWFDRHGAPIADEEEVQRLLRDTEYRRIGVDQGPDGAWISTQWTGMDIGDPGRVPPRIFETRVLDTDGSTSCLERYATEVEARAGHLRHVAWMQRLFREDESA